MEARRAVRLAPSLAVLATLLAVAAEQQVLVLSGDKLPTVLPLHAAAEEPKAIANATTTTDASVATQQTLLPNLQVLQALQTLQTLQNLQNLQGAVDRAKRSGNILQLLGGASTGGASGGAGPPPAIAGAGGGALAGGLGGGLLGGKGILGSLLGSSSGNSAAAAGGKGPTYGNYIGTGAGLPMVYGQRSFDLQSFKRSLMGVLMQAVRAITGGVIALKGQLVRVKGQLLSAKGNIISASGEALSQFGRNIASNALSPKPPDVPAPPRPVYGPPAYMGMLPIPRPVYGPPMFGHGSSFTMGHMATLGQLPIPRPMYGVPSLPPGLSHMQPQPPVFNVYSNAFNQPRYRAVPPPLPLVPPAAKAPPALPPQPLPLPSLPVQYSSHSISGALDSYGPPASGTPLTAGGYFGNGAPPTSPGTSLGDGASPSSSATSFSTSGSHYSGGSSYPSGTSYSDTSLSLPERPEPSNHGSGQQAGSYSPASAPTGSAAPHDVNSLSYPETGESFDAAEPASHQAEGYYKRNANQGRGAGKLDSLQGVHAGFLLLKPVKDVPSQSAGLTNSAQDSLIDDHKPTQAKEPPAYLGFPQSGADGSQYDLPDLRARLGEVSADASGTVNKNDRIFSLLFGAKKPTPLRPHPVTRALPPQVVAAASAQLAAQLDLAGRAPPRTAVAVSGPQGKFIMYHK